MATGFLVDIQTGYPIMLTESTILTALRTGATSAVATKYLANKRSKILGIIGNGVQAMPYLHAISLIRDIEKVYAYDTDEKASKSFKNSAQKLANKVSEVKISDAKIASRESDILVTVTNKGVDGIPIVFDNWIREGTHINAVGGCVANQVELEKSLLERGKVVVDFRDQAINEGESQQLPERMIYSDLSDIVSYRRESRVKEDEVTIFDSVGFAMEDLQMLKIVYELAVSQGVGKRVNIAARPNCSKDLYESYFL
jgi:ornithine cyclodeaminase/alanine dehydrogenase-like protein (mu-crystallin family)